jgi:formate-dependent nitrite reductase membrane component NrfD
VIERAPYGRQTPTVRDLQAPVPYQGETYYGQSAIKPSHYGQLVASYLFVGGLAGASAMIATVADLCGTEEDGAIVRAGRYVALAGVLTGPMFLIADLQTPQRWYNMLRIFRPTSAMSIGSWTLTLFGATTALTGAAQVMTDRTGSPLYRYAARCFGVPAATLGCVAATYTGTLLAATSNPFWARGSRFLPALFGLSATTTATAALSLAAHLQQTPRGTQRRLERLALIAEGAELLLTTAIEHRWEREKLSIPLKEQPIAQAYRGYKRLGVAAPLIIHGLRLLTRRRRSKGWSIAAAVATLAGGYILRSVILSAGKASARRPEDYFRFTQPS